MELSLIDPGLGLLRRLRRMLIAHREIRGLGYAGKDGSRTAKESQLPFLAPNRRCPDLLISQIPTITTKDPDRFRKRKVDRNMS